MKISAKQMKLLADANNSLTEKDIKLKKVLKKIRKKAKQGKYSYTIYFVAYERGEVKEVVEKTLISLGYVLDKDEYGTKITWDN